MRHVFIVNPAAGKDKPALRMIPEIEAYFSGEKAAGGDSYEIYRTKAPRDAVDYVRSLASQGGPLRFYACGGDGTLMEVLNGAYGFPQCEVGSIPCGSANDFVRGFAQQDGAGLFASVAAQAEGVSVPMDAIDCNGHISLNICTIGMDADVADKMVYFKRFPLVSGPMAYNLAIVYMFFHTIGRRLRVRMETERGVEERTGSYLFSLAANGQYYGGGYRGAPQAVPDDGLLDFVLVDTIGRLAVPGFLKKYKAGRHLEMPVVHSFRGPRMQVSSPDPLTVCVDGECFSSREVVFTVLPGAVRFILPRGIRFPQSAGSGREKIVKKL